MTDTTGPRDAAWEQEYRKRRRAFETGVIISTETNHGGDARRTREALDAHVLTEVARLREALEQIAGLRMVAGTGFMPDSVSYLRPEQYYARVEATARRALHTDATD